jgi:uncharacterized repeat protein (TIGR01451 family)
MRRLLGMLAVAAAAVSSGVLPAWGTPSASGDVTLVSASGGGLKGNFDSEAAGLSADGSLALFSSFSTNLVPADQDELQDVFLKDLSTGALQLLSTSSAGIKGNGSSTAISFTPDGSTALFWSTATNLDPMDRDTAFDVYVKHVTGGLVLASTSSSGQKSNGDSVATAVSADGTKVLFSSSATNLDPADTDPALDVYLKDLTTGTLTLVSSGSDGTKGDRASQGDAISANGTRVLFSTLSDNFDPADEDDVWDVYLKDLTTGSLTIVSTSSNGLKGDDDSFGRSLDAAGASAMFTSNASNLDALDQDALDDVFLKDVGTGGLKLVSATLGGVKGDQASLAATLSADGHTALFTSFATNLDPLDGDLLADVYAKNVTSGELRLASTSAGEVKGDADSFGGALSADGTQVLLSSSARNLSPADQDEIPDVFRKDLSPATADLGVEVLGPNGPVPLGVPMTYRIVVRNDGPDVAAAAWLRDPVPAGTQFVKATTSQGVCSLVTGNIVVCLVGDLPASGTVDVRIVVRPVEIRRLVNVVTVGADQPDPNVGDNLVKTRNGVFGGGSPA